MKISDWISIATTITLSVCLGLHTLVLRTHEQRMNALSCKIDLANARINLLRGEPVGDTPCLDAILKKSKAADLRSYDFYVPATKPL